MTSRSAAVLGAIAVALTGCSSSPDIASPDTTPPDTDSGLTLVDVWSGGPAGTDADRSDGEVTSSADAGCPQVCPASESSLGPCDRAELAPGTCTCEVVYRGDGAPCDDGDPCTVAAACLEGACVGGQAEVEVEPADGWVPEGHPLARPDEPEFWDSAIHVDGGCKECDARRVYSAWEAYPGNYLCSVAPADAGGVVATQCGFPPAHLLHFDGGLEQTWSQQLAEPALALGRRVRQWTNGDWVVTGWRGGTLKTGWVGRFTPTGELAWELEVTDRRFFSPVETPDGGVLVVATDGDFNLRLYRLGTQGTPAWEAVVGKAWPNPVEPYEVALTHAGHAVVASLRVHEETTRYMAQVAWVDPGGTVLSSVDLDMHSFHSMAGPIARTVDERFLVGGNVALEGGGQLTPDLKFWLVDGEGKVHHDLLLPVPRSGALGPCIGAAQDSLVAAPDNGAVAVGAAGFMVLADEGIALSFVVRLDGWGNLSWSRLYGDFADDQIGGGQLLNDVAVAADGRLTLVGGADLDPDATTTSFKHWLVRTDPWGRTCHMRVGKCATLTLQDCSDDNPCTIDWCDPDEGCTHPLLPDGSPCGDTETCTAGVCE